MTIWNIGNGGLFFDSSTDCALWLRRFPYLLDKAVCFHTHSTRPIRVVKQVAFDAHFFPSLFFCS